MTKPLGRPRSAKSERAVLEATWRLLKVCSVRDLSIEAIAREAGVGKTTIYRWWPSKAAVVVDTFITKIMPEIPFTQTQSASLALKEQVAALVKAFSGDYGRIIGEIVAEGQAYSDALERFRDCFLLPRRGAARAVIERGITTGEFDPQLDPELAMDILYGPIYYRLLVGHLPLDEDFALKLPEQALRCFFAETGTAKDTSW